VRTRTAFCSHGFLIPGKPEPWTVPVSKGGAELKASRFCLRCWETHGHVFRSYRFDQIVTEDAVQFGFFDLIQHVLKDRAWYRDQDRYEFLETELRMHLLEKRNAIEKALREQTAAGQNQYVRKVLSARLHDLQKHEKSEFQVTINSESYDEQPEQKPDFDPSDESDHAARIAGAAASVVPFQSTEGEDTHARSHKAARSITANRIVESEEEIVQSLDPLRRPSRGAGKLKSRENAELVRAAVEEQGHRIDALTSVSREEQAREISKAHSQLFRAVGELPHDEQTAIRMRFLDGNELRNGKPRSRQDILRELRINGNGASRWTEWDLRRLEQQAVIRLRQKVKLPSVFNMRD
jgi:hypothetical protein